MSAEQVHEFADALARSSRAVKSAAGEAMRALGVHAGQNFVLEELWREDGLAPGELARRIGVDVSTVTRTAQRMEVAGLVRRVPDRDDARLVRVFLSERGNALREQLPVVLEGVYARLLASLTPDERTELVRLLRAVAERPVELSG
ncbi:MAG: MarR family winged helix-turn-helix transcriptional regulator [Solirubrobacteraceae bacterium]